MQTHHDTDHRVLEVIVRSPGNMLDDIVIECSDLTWNQVFIAIDRLSREGALTLTPKGQGLYTIRLSNQVLQEFITTSTSEELVRRKVNLDTTHI
jgi:hypothetical protein